MEFKSFVYTLNELWKDELLCDITLVSGDQHIKAHKIILSGVSEYFKKMFCSNFSESTSVSVNLDHFDPATLKETIKWIYGNEIEITSENAFALLNAASMLFLTVLQHRIRIFIEENMTVNNCLSCLLSTRNSDHNQLERYSLEMVNECFAQVCETEEFKKLPEKLLYQLKKEIQPQKKFVRVVVAVGGSADNFKKGIRMSECLVEGEVRWSSMVPSILNKDGVALALLPAPRWHAAYAGYNSSLFLFGGLTKSLHEEENDVSNLEDLCPDNVTLEYSMITNNWINRTPVPLPTVMNASATYMIEHGLIYLTGGSINNSDISDKVFAYNPRTDNWREAPSLLNARMGHCTVAVHGQLYVLGGLNTNSLTLNSCERFDSNLGRWTLCTPMHRSRTSFACAALGRYIWVLGGYSYQWGSKVTLGWCERYDTLEDIWLDSIKLFPSRWGNIAAGPFGTRRPRRDLIIAGGSNELILSHDTVRFNTVSERPNPAAIMLYPRQDFGMCLLILQTEIKVENP